MTNIFPSISKFTSAYWTFYRFACFYNFFHFFYFSSPYGDFPTSRLPWIRFSIFIFYKKSIGFLYFFRTVILIQIFYLFFKVSHSPFRVPIARLAAAGLYQLPPHQPPHPPPDCPHQPEKPELHHHPDHQSDHHEFDDASLYETMLIISVENLISP